MKIENVIESGTEAMKKALKPCPFCGCNVINLHQETNADGYFFAWFECRACGARGQTRRYMGVTFDPTLRDTWNSRKSTETKKRGWWRADGAVCSCCGYIRQQTRSGNYIVGDYCPKCGAEMEAEAIE